MSAQRIHVVACGVLAVDIRHLAREYHIEIETTYLPGGLHNNPKELRRRLQATIDEISAAGKADYIAIGYGVCGRGAVGIHARNIPLAIPRVHDCIALFLGSDAAYRREFGRYPGTYYISAGWVQEKVQPKGSGDGACGPTACPPEAPKAEQDGCGCQDVEFVKLAKEHGEENAQAIRYFLSSWQRNYQRAAFIDTGAEEHRRYAAIARNMADRFGWKYEELSGSGNLLRKLIRCDGSGGEILLVPANHVTVYDPIVRGMQAVPVWEAGQEAQEGVDQVIEIGSAGDSAGQQAMLGLGIDAGGTYTDVAIYGFAADRVLQKAKALTTKWDYTIGISAALDQLDPKHLRQVDLVSISTTLATNAVVEGRGQAVGLLVMPPYGLFESADITHRPVVPIGGQLDIDGTEVRPIDADEIRRVAQKLVKEEHVGAFAVTGYASHINPAHELEVRKILEAETGLPVTCGHEVSSQLNYRVRAHTAALNGRIIPILLSFLEQAARSLHQRGVDAPMMVVRSDGSLMSIKTARQRPIETLLSGPAASVAGARYLAKVASAYVVDVGGTTTDTALIRQGAVSTSREGAKVGGWQTHVQALDMRTTGLGGDSLISQTHGELQIGPRRVAPIAWLGTRVSAAALEKCFEWIETELEANGLCPGLLDLYTLNNRPDETTLTDRERRIVQALTDRPYSAHELARRVQEHWWETLDLERLEREHLVQRCGLTPTDLLHVSGSFERWDREAARRMLEVFSRGIRRDAQQTLERILALFVRRLALEAVKKQLDEQTDADELDHSDVCKVLLDNWASGGDSPDYQVRIRLKHPIIGIGAPVGHFLPAAAKLLETEAIVPEHADVANAIGAITSSVVIQKQVEISPEANGRFCLRGVPGAPTFAALLEARAAAVEALKSSVTAAAREAGTSGSHIRISINDRIAPMGEDGQVFVGEIIEAKLDGRPDLLRLAQA